LKTTAKGICLNLNESEYYFKIKGLVFYFSSEFYRKKFVDEFENYLERETFKLQVKYNMNINFDILFMISLYKKIEKRGFRIYDEENKKEITPSCGILAKILMY
jgi:YHS domain-containing protein